VICNSTIFNGLLLWMLWPYGLVLCSNLDRILYPSICLLCLDSDYRMDKNKNINTFNCYFAFLSTLMAGGLPALSHLSFFLCSALDYGVWRSHFFVCV
jgi:hypothetical protein